MLWRKVSRKGVSVCKRQLRPRGRQFLDAVLCRELAIAGFLTRR
jgi:hypothetical protein